MRNTSGLKPFKPGQSGNPGGRPKGTGISAYLRKLGRQKTTVTVNGKERTVTTNEAIARSIIDLALDPKSKYHIEAIKIYLDRTEGKAVDTVIQQLDLSGGAIVPRLTELDAEDIKKFH